MIRQALFLLLMSGELLVFSKGVAYAKAPTGPKKRIALTAFQDKPRAIHEDKILEEG